MIRNVCHDAYKGIFLNFAVESSGNIGNGMMERFGCLINKTCHVDRIAVRGVENRIFVNADFTAANKDYVILRLVGGKFIISDENAAHIFLFLSRIFAKNEDAVVQFLHQNTSITMPVCSCSARSPRTSCRIS